MCIWCTLIVHCSFLFVAISAAHSRRNCWKPCFCIWFLYRWVLCIVSRCDLHECNGITGTMTMQRALEYRVYKMRLILKETNLTIHKDNGHIYIYIQPAKTLQHTHTTKAHTIFLMSRKALSRLSESLISLRNAPHYYPELSGVSLEDAKKKAEEPPQISTKSCRYFGTFFVTDV